LKHGKHSIGKSDFQNDIDIVSSTKKHRKKIEKDREIRSSTPTGVKAFERFVNVLFIISALAVVFVVLYAIFNGILSTSLLPKKLLIVALVAIAIAMGIYVALQALLLYGKKKRGFGFYFTRIFSMMLAVFLSLASYYAFSHSHAIVNFFDESTTEKKSETAVESIKDHPFVVYLSGLDTRKKGEIADKGLSDVNMIVVVNPKQKRILMVSTPRDYYVDLKGIDGVDDDTPKYDKLTHAGTKGIECSKKTLENLYDVKFNYHAKVNFKSVYDIVNAVDGVTVESDYDFYSRYSYSGRTYHFVKGKNNLTGDSALAFARERKSFAAGDRQRGIHQQVVIKAVVEKATTLSMLTTSADDILDAVSENTKTNFTKGEIKGLIKYQLDTIDKKWKFESISVDGKGGMDYTYSYPGQRLWVMYPDIESIDYAKAAINAVMEGKELPEPADKASSTN